MNNFSFFNQWTKKKENEGTEETAYKLDENIKNNV